jgi:hypothetical protein
MRAILLGLLSPDLKVDEVLRVIRDFCVINRIAMQQTAHSITKLCWAY